MRTFIDEVIDKVWDQFGGVDQITFVLPSKRAGTFLKKAVSKKAGKTIFAPTVYSIEEFIEQISNLTYATATEQLFELYTAYLQIGDYEKDSFDAFLTWGQTLLQDFNEIDRYLVDAKALLSNLSAIQEINHWSASSEKTTLIENYISFWNNILPIYNQFNSNLLTKNLGHQGLVYRKASEEIKPYLKQHSETHVFLGFNALNEAESRIIQTILETTNSEIYWDIDPYFLNDPIHDAGLFIRQHQKNWPTLQHKKLQGLSTVYEATKHIEVVGVPKNVSQAKYIGKLLSNFQENQPDCLKKTALILGDETLLTPLLNAIPESIPAVNITMGQKLELTPLSGFFMEFFELHETANKKGWFFKDFIRFLSHPYSSVLLSHNQIDLNVLIQTIKKRNWTFVNLETIATTVDINSPVIKLLFSRGTYNTSSFLKRCTNLVSSLKEAFALQENNLALEQLYKFHTLFIQIENLASSYDFMTNLRALKNLVHQLVSKETLDFQGDPLEGLQLMGMLESRNLDFEQIIISSVNEGILPSGKSNNSFIPFDLKIAHGMPTYKEKDAVYTYHFYRLLQRAKHIYLIYNTEPDVLEGGEKSRLISQLLTEGNGREIIEKIASPELQPIITNLITLHKSETLVKQIAEYAEKGFSPSSLSNYIRNPIDFYKQNILGIKDTLAVEETIAANTFGTIVHDSLEDLYTPFLGVLLTKENLIEAKTKLTETIERNFKKTYLDGNFSTGKNYLSFHVIHKYISNFLDSEIEAVQNHAIKIIALEQHMEISIAIPTISHPITLKGKLDRIDEIDGILRIIDYKTGKVEKGNVELLSYEDLIEDYKYSKAFQLLCYAYMYTKDHPSKTLQAGIISLKNLKAGVLLFAKKEAPRGPKNLAIDSDTLNNYETALFSLIKEICDPNTPFIEKEV